MTNLLYDDKIEFYTNQFGLGFDSKVYDLRDGAFREYKLDDYISMSVGFDIDRQNIDRETEELMNIIKDIAGDQAPFLLKLFASTLFGKALEKFTILRGYGRNGKSLILEIIYNTLRQYAYRASPDLVTNLNPKGGGIRPCPEIAQMHNKRLIITSEPSSQGKFITNFIKNVTKGTEITGRDFYCSK